MKKKINYGPLYIDPIAYSAKTTPTQRVHWLKKTKRFVLKAMGKSTRSAILKLRLDDRAS